jgi:outer membrane protein OmpA-like peptidoglycan-associated protein
MRPVILAFGGLCLLLGGCADTGLLTYMDRQAAALMQKLGESGITMDRRGDDILMQMPDVTFDTGRATIKAEYRAVLDDMALILNEYGNTGVAVTGHADATGTPATNQRLSESRARAVVAYLIRQDVDEARLTATGEGETRPVASNDTVEGRAQNRRVEIVIRQKQARGLLG